MNQHLHAFFLIVGTYYRRRPIDGATVFKTKKTNCGLTVFQLKHAQIQRFSENIRRIIRHRSDLEAVQMSDTHRPNLIAPRRKQSGAAPGSVYREGFSPWPPASCRAPPALRPLITCDPPPTLKHTHPLTHTALIQSAALLLKQQSFSLQLTYTFLLFTACTRANFLPVQEVSEVGVP